LKNIEIENKDKLVIDVEKKNNELKKEIKVLQMGYQNLQQV
jgi:hypothetical protein